MTTTASVPDLSARIARELAGLIAIRHDLHQHPELNYEERRTSGVVQRELAKLNIPFRTGIAETGVVARLPATSSGDDTLPAVALRADMDALPIFEQTGKPYASTIPGKMHACGHDGHTTMLIGAARVLAALPHRPRPVVFLFQPAEEGGAGGERMTNEGALDGVGEIFGLHGWPTYPVGHIATRVGPLMASVDDVELTVRGVQSHGAYPHQGFDPIVATAHIVTALQSIASRNVSPLDSVVVTCGEIKAGTANNIIPESCWSHWTVRTLRDSTRAYARKRFIDIATSVAEAFGCRADVTYRESYPVTHNDAHLVGEFFKTARAISGPTAIAGFAEVPEPTMGGEDFSYYGKKVPACFFFLGLKPEAADRYPTLHQPDFDFNDAAIATGVEMFVRLATR